MLASILTHQEDIFFILNSIIDDRALSTRQKIQRETLRVKSEQRELTKTQDTSNTYRKIGNAASLVTSITSIGIGISICTAGTGIALLGGTALILSGGLAISAYIMRECGVSNTTTTTIEITGGIVGLASGGLSVATASQASQSYQLALNIGKSFIHATSLSSDFAATIYTKKSFTKEALIKLLEKEIKHNSNYIKDASTLSGDFIDSYNNNLLAVIEALDKEIKTIDASVQKQQMRG